MRVARTIAELTGIRDELTARQPRPTVAFVPTLGALHAGHRSMFSIAHQAADVVVVSIFVNPLQFGADEDYARFPRTLDEDLSICRSEEVDVVFVPTVAELYPAGRQVSVHTGQLGTTLEGRSRPGHFDGVVTVLAKLFNLVRPDKAVFNQRDAQQLAVVRRMVADLNCDIDILTGPIVRDDDGLAWSGRNRYLLPHQRTSALALSAALRSAGRQDSVPAALQAARSVTERAEGAGTFRLDYLALVHPQTFAPLPPDYAGQGLLLVAAWVGDTRLIDNAQLSFTSPPDSDVDPSQLEHVVAGAAQ